MTQEKVLKEAKLKYVPHTVIRSAWSGDIFNLEEDIKLSFDSDGDLRVRNTFGNPVLWQKSSNNWAEVISSPEPPVPEIINQFPIY
jgi:hypothetical protein